MTAQAPPAQPHRGVMATGHKKHKWRIEDCDNGYLVMLQVGTGNQTTGRWVFHDIEEVFNFIRTRRAST